MLCPVNHRHDEEYPEHLKHLAPTDADLDMLLEATHGRPYDHGSAAANAQALQERITQLQSQRARLISNAEQLDPAVFAAHLASYEADLGTARQLLADYQAQLGSGN